jgi:type I restriction enzyme S subunit
MSWKSFKFSDLFDYENKSSIKAGEGLIEGKFSFYTSSSILSKYLNEFSFEKTSLIFGTGGNASIHYCENPFSVSTDCLVAIAKDETKCDPKFVFYYLSGNINILEEGFKGAGLKHISKAFINEITIPLPPLSIQKRIAEILDAADALRRKDQELLNKFDELSQAIFIDMFGDPVKNVKGWKLIPFVELFDSRLGKMLDAKKQNGEKKYKYLGNSNLQWFRYNLDNLSEMEFDENELEKFVLKKGDVLICEGGEVGRCAIWNNEMSNVYFQKAIHRARIISNNITPEYTVMLFWFFAKFGGLNDYVTAATIAHLTGEKLKTIPIPVPPIEMQNSYKDAILKLNKQKELFAKSQYYSENLFQSLIQQSFNGELVKHFIKISLC